MIKYKEKTVDEIANGAYKLRVLSVSVDYKSPDPVIVIDCDFLILRLEVRSKDREKREHDTRMLGAIIRATGAQDALDLVGKEFTFVKKSQYLIK